MPCSLAELFAHPPAAFRGKPFWSWNGRLDRDELRRQAGVFKAMGMGGYFMHSRTGLKTEYLGDEWFECIKACADEAELLGMEAWLYDEDRWPSGSAGGLATADPRFRMKVLRLRVTAAEAFAWPASADLVAVFAARIEGLDCAEITRLEAGAPAPRDGRQVLVFTTEAWAGHSFYNGNTYLDTLSSEATAHFLQLTHERYAARCGDRLGRSIRGIFTDEPHRGTVMCENNENRAMADQRWTTPWTEALFGEFEKAWGYDLRAHLPELFLFPEGRRVSAVKWHYMELLQRMFLENWAKPLHAWCRSHGLALTGHVLHEDSLVAQAVPGGSVMRYYEHLEVPGVDVLALHNGNYWIVKQLASAARQFGQKWMLSELYGCTGWQLDFAGHKRIGAWQALLGINLRCHHLSWATMEGEAKRDYPASIHFQSAWWRQYAAVEDYFARLHVVLQQGERVCDVLVINPIESTWAQIHPGWAQWLSALDPELENLERSYREIFAWLSGAQLDFDYGDEDHLARFARVEPGNDGPQLRLGEAVYRVVIVAGLVTMRATTLRLLQDFASAGGAVIFAGPPPEFIDARPVAAARELAAIALAVPMEEAALVAKVRERSRSPLRIHGAEGASERDLLCQLRRDGAAWWIAVINTSETEWRRDVRLTMAAEGAVEEWDCATGEHFRQPASLVDGALEWSCDFPPLGERVFAVTPQVGAALRERSRFTATEVIPLAGPFVFELDEPNICVLDFAEHQLGEGPWQPAAEILQVDAAVRTQLGLEPRSGVMLQPWAASPAAPGSPVRLRLRFRFAIAVLPVAPVELLLEHPREIQLTVNGAPLECPAETSWFIDPCFRRIPLRSEWLCRGENEVVLEMPMTAASELEAIYLLGTFGVTLEGPRPQLGELPARLHPRDVAAQGLPFYSGKITYHLPLPPGHNGRAMQLELGTFGGAVAQVRSPETETGALVAWPPFTADLPAASGSLAELRCDVWLTRRNTFGPLHLTPREQPAIGPASFRSEGAEFTRDYVLFPSGLLAPPHLRLGG